ncbi:hypothetical protein BDA96_05G202000 [Sorghum bicolor]|uniref:Uncharacterized protein n=1 Tax=Sorghum bicolor TaxID=4558 RepID=A0A921R0B0_SORBI|nr:hypothetical protein BDA96_05G202000 [Sorghum bicolor]
MAPPMMGCCHEKAGFTKDIWLNGSHCCCCRKAAANGLATGLTGRCCCCW